MINDVITSHVAVTIPAGLCFVVLNSFIYCPTSYKC